MTRGEKEANFAEGIRISSEKTGFISKFSCFLASNSHLSSKIIFKIRIVSSADERETFIHTLHKNMCCS